MNRETGFPVSLQPPAGHGNRKNKSAYFSDSILYFHLSLCYDVFTVRE